MQIQLREKNKLGAPLAPVALITLTTRQTSAGEWTATTGAE